MGWKYADVYVKQGGKWKLKSDHCGMEITAGKRWNYENYVKIRPLWDGNMVVSAENITLIDALKSDHCGMEIL